RGRPRRVAYAHRRPLARRHAGHVRRRSARSRLHHRRRPPAPRAGAHDHRRVHPIPSSGGRVTANPEARMPLRKSGYGGKVAKPSTPAQPTLPEILSAGGQSIDVLRSEAAGCEACDLYKLGTQTVFGEGTEDADLILMGEVPGDQEDKRGHPFVGPAGKLLDRALVEAEIDRDNVYVTNAVKHFKSKPQGKVRLHQKPNAKEIAACR